VWRSVAFCMIACISPEPVACHVVASPEPVACRLPPSSLSPVAYPEPFRLLTACRLSSLPSLSAVGCRHRNGNFDADYGDIRVEDKLDIMESSYVSRQCLSIEAKWCASVTAVTLTVSMGVNIQGCSPCCGILT
jgi:hypothetical protein